MAVARMVSVRSAKILVGIASCTTAVALAQAVAPLQGEKAAAGSGGASGDPEPATVLARMSIGTQADLLPIVGAQPLQGGISTGRLDMADHAWLGYGRTAFGPGPHAPRIDPPFGLAEMPPFQHARALVSVDLRYRFKPDSHLYAGATAARSWEDALPRYNAKAGLEWKMATSRLGFDAGRLGLQLDSGYRMSIRTRSGGVQLALRRTF